MSQKSILINNINVKTCEHKKKREKSCHTHFVHLLLSKVVWTQEKPLSRQVERQVILLDVWRLRCIALRQVKLLDVAKSPTIFFILCSQNPHPQNPTPVYNDWHRVPIPYGATDAPFHRPFRLSCSYNM